MFNQLAELINQSENIVFFGGAGVSTESGIPDFRGSKGLYTAKTEGEIAPEKMINHRFFLQNPQRFYDYYRSHMLFPDAQPNYAHIALAKLEEMGKLSCVITQNIDGLHQKAGAKHVIELHGSALRNYCIQCKKQYDLPYILQTEAVPTCTDCGGIVRPDVVLYEERLPVGNLVRAEEAVAKADLLIVGGTSLTVHPAAGIVAEFCGEDLVILNQTPTPYDPYAKLVIREPIGEVFQRIASKIFG